MGLIRSLFESRSARLDDSNMWLTTAGGGSATYSGVTINADSAMKVSTVYACTALLSGAIASLPLQLYRSTKKGQDPATSHYLYDRLYRSPNNEQNSYEFREMEQSHLCLRGNGFIYKEYGNDGRIKSLIPLNPACVTVKRENGAIWFYYNPNSDDPLTPAPYRFPSSSIWHIKGLSTSGLLGLSPVSVAREAIGLAAGAEQFGGQFFGNKPIPGLIARHPRQLSPAARDGLKASIQDFTSSKRHMVMVLEEGMDVTPVGISNEDAQFLEARAFQVEDICRFFNVPPFLVHHQRDKASTFASAEQLSLNFVIYSLLTPWIVRWEQSMNKALLSPEEQSHYFFKFNLNALQRGAYSDRMKGYALGRQWGIFSPNDVRALEDLNPRDGGDHYIDDPKNITGKSGGDNANNSKQQGSVPSEPADSQQ